MIQQGKVENFKQPLRDVRTDNTGAVGSGFRSNERFHPHQASNWEKVQNFMQYIYININPVVYDVPRIFLQMGTMPKTAKTRFVIL